jgi:arylsulfatase A-like enzyme
MKLGGILAWLVCALIGAWAVVRADSLVALPGEALAPGLVTIALHLVLAIPLVWLLTRGRRPWLVFLPPAVLGVAWLALQPGAPVRPDGLANGPSVVLITLDTFRADHLGIQGGQAETPNLDALAESGALFRNAVTTAPLTAPAHASMLTGLTVHEHGLVANGGRMALQGTLATRYLGAGYHTGAFLSSRVLDRSTGLAQGFEHYDDRWGWVQRLDGVPGVTAVFGHGRPAARSGQETVDRALRWVDQQQGPYLLWVHLYDTHAPYLPPTGWRPTPDELAEAAAADRVGREPAQDRASFLRNLEQGFGHGQRLLYRSAVHWTDHLVGEIVAGVPAAAVILVVGDHGESLDEHGYYFNHGANLLEPSMRVPLILRWSEEFEPGMVSDDLVGVLQVAPTLLEVIAGDPSPHRDPQGPPSLTLGWASELLLYTPGQQARSRLGRPPGNGEPVVALRKPGSKLVLLGDGQLLAYDLVADPHELNPMEPGVELIAERGRLEALLGQAPSAPDAQQLEWLEAIGYTEW